MRVFAPADVEVREQEPVAVPPLPDRLAGEAQLAEPSDTLTVPVGVTPLAPTTWTETVYACPTVDGFGVLPVIVVVVV